MSVRTRYIKNRAQLVAETLRLVDDPGGERFEAERAEELLNEAALDFNLTCSMVVESVSVALEAAVWELDAARVVAESGSLRAYGSALRVIWGSGPALKPITALELDFMGVARGTPGDPLYWVTDLLSPNRIAVFPVPARTETLEITFAALPRPMEADEDSPDLPPLHHTALCYGAAARLLEEGDEADLERSLVLETEFRHAKLRAAAAGVRGETAYSGFAPA
jgi:hypothetical protein